MADRGGPPFGVGRGLTALTVKILAFLHEVGSAHRNMRLDRPTRWWGDYVGMNDGEMRCGSIYIYIHIYIYMLKRTSLRLVLHDDKPSCYNRLLSASPTSF